MSDRSIEDYCYYQSPIGLIRMGETGGFLTRADFVEQSPESKHFQSDGVSNSSTLLKDACRQLDEYFEGRRQKFDLALKPHGTYFQRSAGNHCSAYHSVKQGVIFSRQSLYTIPGQYVQLDRPILAIPSPSLFPAIV